MKCERQSFRRKPKTPPTLILLFFFGLDHAPYHL